jgi:HlyD family secretion protein
MNKKLLAGIAGAAIIVVGAVAMLARGGGGPTAGKYEFETAAVERGDVARVISASGAVQPRNKVDVGSEVSGKIVELMVDFNSPVKKGQVLAQIDPETFITQVNSAQAALLQSRASVANARSAISRAEAQLAKAKQDYDRNKKLFEEGALAQSQWEQFQQTYTLAGITLDTEKASLQSAQAGLSRSQASLDEAKLRLDRTKILSPIDGVVLNRKVEVGQTVQSSQTVAQFFVIAQDLSEIQIEASVVESDIGGVDDGDTATFQVDAYPGETFRGRVVQVRQQGAEQANVVTYTVVVEAPNPNGRLKPGMTANAEITVDRATNVLRIAEGATKVSLPRELAEKFGGQGGPGGPGGNRGPGGQGGPQMAMMGGGGGGGQMVAMSGGQRQGGQGGNRQGGPGGGRGGPGGNNMQVEMLKEIGVDEARAMKIQNEMQAEMQKIFASMPQMPQQQGGALGGGVRMGPPPQMMQQQQQQEMRAKMQQTQERVMRANLSEEEYIKYEARRVEMQTQKRAPVYVLNDKGELERKMLMIGLADGNYAQVLRGAEEGEKFVLRVTSNKPAKKS